MFRVSALILLSLWGLFAYSANMPPVLIADIVDKESSEKLFTYKRIEQAKDKGSEVIRTFKYPDGRLAAEETVTYIDGRSKKFVQKHPQIGAEGFFEVRGDKVFFSYTQNGKTKTDEEKYVDNFTCVDEVVSKIYDNFEKLMKGESIKIRLAVLDRRETVGFEIFKIDDRERGGKTWTVFKMKPSSFFIAALVEPLYFYAEKEGNHRIFEVDGRVVPKREVAGHFKDLDALLKVIW